MIHSAPKPLNLVKIRIRTCFHLVMDQIHVKTAQNLRLDLKRFAKIQNRTHLIKAAHPAQETTLILQEINMYSIITRRGKAQGQDRSLIQCPMTIHRPHRGMICHHLLKKTLYLGILKHEELQIRCPLNNHQKRKLKISQETVRSTKVDPQRSLVQNREEYHQVEINYTA